MPVSTCWAGSGVSAPVGVAVELDEDEVPDLHDARVVAVDVRAAGFVRRAVDVDFGARAARAGVAHLPEIVLAEVVDVVVGAAGDSLPDVGGFGVARDAVLLVAFETVTCRRVGSSFQTLVSSSHAISIAPS